MKVIETISTSVSPDALNGSTPNSLALSPDNSTLYVANADNNFLAVIDVEKFGESRSKGFIPTGWYPTVVRCVDDLLLVANGKGMVSKANPHYAPEIGEIRLILLSLSLESPQKYSKI